MYWILYFLPIIGLLAMLVFHRLTRRGLLSRIPIFIALIIGGWVALNWMTYQKLEYIEDHLPPLGVLHKETRVANGFRTNTSVSSYEFYHHGFGGYDFVEVESDGELGRFYSKAFKNKHCPPGASIGWGTEPQPISSIASPRITESVCRREHIDDGIPTRYDVIQNKISHLGKFQDGYIFPFSEFHTVVKDLFTQEVVAEYRSVEFDSCAGFDPFCFSRRVHFPFDSREFHKRVLIPQGAGVGALLTSVLWEMKENLLLLDKNTVLLVLVPYLLLKLWQLTKFIPRNANNLQIRFFVSCCVVTVFVTAPEIDFILKWLSLFQQEGLETGFVRRGYVEGEKYIMREKREAEFASFSIGDFSSARGFTLYNKALARTSCKRAFERLSKTEQQALYFEIDGCAKEPFEMKPYLEELPDIQHQCALMTSSVKLILIGGSFDVVDYRCTVKKRSSGKIVADYRKFRFDTEGISQDIPPGRSDYGWIDTNPFYQVVLPPGTIHALSAQSGP